MSKVTKTCSKCKEEKPASQFHKLAKSSDGLYWYCKSCRKEYRRKSRKELAPKKVAVQSKFCARCNREKPAREFPRWKHSQDGLDTYCTVCKSSYQKEYYRENKERLIKKQSQYYAKHRDKILAYQKEWQSRHENKERYRDLNYQRRFGITIEDYERMLAEQGGVCAICGCTDENERYQRLAVDHCHNTEAVRGLLCHRCNTGIGLFNDDPETIRRAIEYLKAYSQKGPHSEGTE